MLIAAAAGRAAMVAAVPIHARSAAEPRFRKQRRAGGGPDYARGAARTGIGGGYDRSSDIDFSRFDLPGIPSFSKPHIIREQQKSVTYMQAKFAIDNISHPFYYLAIF